MPYTRQKARIVLLLGTVILFSCCQSKRSAQASATSKDASRTASSAARGAEVETKGEDWQRTKECAEQADRIATRNGWVIGQRTEDHTVMGWRNHYSPKYGRCYILVSYMNRAALKDRDRPLLFDELFDAFEGRLLSTCTDATNSGARLMCSIDPAESPDDDCRTCRKFTKDRMDN